MNRWTKADYATGDDNEYNDCSIRAYSIAACVSYDHAHALFTKHGRTPKKRTSIDTTISVLRKTFPNAIHLFPQMSLSCFMKLHPIGHYLLHTSSHAFALCDGIVHDWSYHPRYKIRHAWRLDT